MTSIQRIRRRAYEIMDGAVPDKYSHFVEVFVALLVVANVIGYKIMRRAVNDASIPKLADGLVAGLVGLL